MSSPIDKRGSSPLPKFDDIAPGSSPKAITSLGRGLRTANYSSFVRTGINATEKVAYKIPGVRAAASLVEGTRAFEVVKTSAKTTSAVLAPITEALAWGIETEQLYTKIQELRDVSNQLAEKREKADGETAPVDTKPYRLLLSKEAALKLEIIKTITRMGCRALKVSVLVGLPITIAAGLGLFLAEEMIDRNKIRNVNKWVFRPIGDSVSRLMTDRKVKAAITPARDAMEGMRLGDFMRLPERKIIEMAKTHLDALYTIKFGMSKRQFEEEKKNLKLEIMAVKSTRSLSLGQIKARVQKLRADFQAKIATHRMIFGQRVPGKDYLLYRFQEVTRDAYNKARSSGADVLEAQQKAKEAALTYESGLSNEEQGILRKQHLDEFRKVGDTIERIEHALKYSLALGKNTTRRKRCLFETMKLSKREHLDRAEHSIEEKSGYRKVARGASWCWQAASGLVKGAYSLVSSQPKVEGVELSGKVDDIIDEREEA